MIESTQASPAQSAYLTAETQPIAGVPEPTDFSMDWLPGAKEKINRRPAPPPELKRFVRAMSELGVPVHEIARRLGEKINVRNYGVRKLYRDFSEDLIPRMRRGPRGAMRQRLVDKPQGWKPIRPGAPFSYGDILAILQSDLDSRDLGRLYGISDELIYKLRRGETKYTKYLLPRMTIAEDVTPRGIAYRAMVTADIAVKLVAQMRNMIEHHYTEKRKGAMNRDSRDTVSRLFRRKTGDGTMEQRIIESDLEMKAAKLDGWTESDEDEELAS